MDELNLIESFGMSIPDISILDDIWELPKIENVESDVNSDSSKSEIIENNEYVSMLNGIYEINDSSKSAAIMGIDEISDLLGLPKIKMEETIMINVNSNKPKVDKCHIHDNIIMKQSLCWKCKCDNRKRKYPEMNAITFFDAAYDKYGTFFSYNKTIFENNRTSIIVTCKIHGDFNTTPNQFIYNNALGCNDCLNEGTVKYTENFKKTFIQKAKKKYGNKYTYDNTIFRDDSYLVSIKCAYHSELKIYPLLFLAHNGNHGCIRCAKLERWPKINMTHDIFIKKSKEKYGDLFNYDKTVFVNIYKKVKITCKKHGDFEIVPRNFIAKLTKYGCKKCYYKRNNEYKRNNFIKRGIKQYGDLFTYDKTVYAGYNETLIVTCVKHGDIVTTPCRFMNKSANNVCVHCAYQVSLTNC